MIAYEDIDDNNDDDFINYPGHNGVGNGIDEDDDFNNNDSHENNLYWLILKRHFLYCFIVNVLYFIFLYKFRTENSHTACINTFMCFCNKIFHYENL